MSMYRRNLERFEMSHNSAMNAVDPDSGNGEVTIRLPPDCFQIIGGKIRKYMGQTMR